MKKSIGRMLLICILLVCTKDTLSDAYKYVYNLYSNYQVNNSTFSYNGPGADTVFSRELLKLIRLDQRLAQGEVGYLESDPICDCQDPDGFKLLNISISNKNSLIFAEVNFQISETKKSLVLHLVQEQGKWLVNDIVSSSGSLHEFLSKSLSENNQESIYKQ